MAVVALRTLCHWGGCVLALALAGCGVWDGDLKHRTTGVPEALSDGWPIAAPEDVSVPAAVLQRIQDDYLREDEQLGTLGFLVARNGQLIYETYFHDPADRDRIHHLMSVTKSVTSMIAGIAYTQGWLPDLSTPICDILVDPCKGKDKRVYGIQLRHILTMQSGLDFDNVDFSLEMWVGKPAQPIDYILSKPFYASAGREYRYRDADPQLMSYVLQQLSGDTEAELAQQYLFAPLGIEDYYWDHGATGETMGAHGLHMRPRDLLKLGQLMLQQGQWQGQQIISPQWVTDSTSAQVPTDDPDFDYGYLWRTVDEVPGYAAWGAGGQFVLVVPSSSMVLVQISRPDTNLLPGSHLSEFVDITRPLWSLP